MRDGPRGFAQNSSCSGLLRCRIAEASHFAYGAFTLCGPAFQRVLLCSVLGFACGPTTPGRASPRARFGLVRVRSPLLPQSLVCFLFLRVLRCFSSPGSPLARPGAGLAPGGLPHSEIRASTGICPYARLIAACHVLRRLREPRHPSCALLSFPFSFICSRFFYLFTPDSSSACSSAVEPRGNPGTRTAREFVLYRFVYSFKKYHRCPP